MAITQQGFGKFYMTSHILVSAIGGRRPRPPLRLLGDCSEVSSYVWSYSLNAKVKQTHWLLFCIAGPYYVTHSAARNLKMFQFFCVYSVRKRLLWPEWSWVWYWMLVPSNLPRWYVVFVAHVKQCGWIRIFYLPERHFQWSRTQCGCVDSFRISLGHSWCGVD